jgi:hypothetical protein
MSESIGDTVSISQVCEELTRYTVLLFIYFSEDRCFLKVAVKTYLMAPKSPVNLRTFFWSAHLQSTVVCTFTAQCGRLEFSAHPADAELLSAQLMLYACSDLQHSAW